MKTVRASSELLPQMKTLWYECFSDKEDYVNQYFAHFGTENGLLLFAEDRLCAMVQWIPVQYIQSDGEEQCGAYLYAVCTASGFRNRGCCRLLLAEAERLLKAEGTDFAFLRPGSAVLAEMYRKFGYAMTLTNSEDNVSAQIQAGTVVKTIPPEAYLQYRQMLLWEDFIDWQLPAIRHQAAQGELLTLTQAERFAVAAVERTEDDVFIKEYLGDLSLAGAIPAKYGAEKAKLRTMGQTPFAMAKALTGKPLPAGYPGFVFD